MIISGRAAHYLVPIRIARTQPSVASTWTGPTIRMTATGAAAAQPMPGTGHTSMHHRLGIRIHRTFFALPVQQRTTHARKRMPAEKIRPNGKQAQACHTPISFLGQMHSTRYNAGHLLECCSVWPGPYLAATPHPRSDPASKTRVNTPNMPQPPKLTPEVVQDLDKFQKNYPGELLGSDSMPSIRLLSMAYEMTKSKHFKWMRNYASQHANARKP